MTWAHPELLDAAICFINSANRCGTTPVNLFTMSVSLGKGRGLHAVIKLRGGDDGGDA